MAEYFLGLWGGGNPKPFEYSDLQRQRFHLDDTKGEADRKVCRILSVCLFALDIFVLFRIIWIRQSTLDVKNERCLT